MRRVKLNPCQKSPMTLYELAASAVEKLRWPDAFSWSEEQVVQWLSEDVGLPEYWECIVDNYINGRRLIFLEDPSVLPMINIHDFEHIKKITAKVREVFSTDFILFARSVGLPIRKPLTHCTWFKTRTGPSWGIRNNWNRCDILRWMKILGPEPFRLNHWDLVWYLKPDFPKTMFARIPKSTTRVFIPHYVKEEEICREYRTPRKFRIQQGIPENEQYIWMESRKESDICLKGKKIKPRKIFCIPKGSNLMPKKVSLKGLKGKELLLARRVSPKQKFYPKQEKIAQIL